jgi:hypothetical protein
MIIIIIIIISLVSSGFPGSCLDLYGLLRAPKNNPSTNSYKFFKSLLSTFHTGAASYSDKINSGDKDLGRKLIFETISSSPPPPPFYKSGESNVNTCCSSNDPKIKFCVCF